MHDFHATFINIKCNLKNVVSRVGSKAIFNCKSFTGPPVSTVLKTLLKENIENLPSAILNTS